jgi:hypothetical protein
MIADIPESRRAAAAARFERFISGLVNVNRPDALTRNRTA